LKPASAATLAIMAAGQMQRIDLYAITLAGGSQSYYFTSHQYPIVVGGQIYQTGLIINRGTVKQTAGLEVDQMQLTISPNLNNSGGVPLIAGLGPIQAARARVFDGARLLFSKMFLADFNDLTPGVVPWFQGRMNLNSIGRLSAVFNVSSDGEMLNVMMPPNLIEKRCRHTVFDAGCALLPSSFQINGTVASGSTVLNVNTNLTQVDKYFSLGRITFLSGLNATNPSTTYFVKFYAQANGQFQLARPLPNVPQAGDTFMALPGCPKTRAACLNTVTAVGPPFNNGGRFRGILFVPVPETLYDGGTTQNQTQSLGGDGGSAVGSPFSSGLGQRNVYKP
jgi:hypothetical protein